MLASIKLVVQCLQQQNVQYIFGTADPKMQALCHALQDSSIKTVLCHYDENAVCMAAACGRVTGRPGVALVGNAQDVAQLAGEPFKISIAGAPLVALAGNIPTPAGAQAKLAAPQPKFRMELTTADNIGEVMTGVFAVARTMQRGSCSISLSQEILNPSSESYSYLIFK